MFVKSCWHLMLFAALVAATGPVCAQGTEAGRFLSVVGDVRVGLEGAPQRVAQRATEFYEGESIITGAGALAQLRMTDGALMSVRGDTEIKLERFSYAGEQDRNASFFMSVLKGGLRTITGVIGRQNRERYRITTATVTIGVRGTDFEIVHVPLQAGSREVPAGTYDRVFEGVTSMQNRAGVMLLVSRDQTAFAALQGNVAPILVPPPAAIFGRPTPRPTITPQAVAMPAVAQYAPRVIFCTGSCFAVDQNGVRTPAPKGTELREGQRLETGPGGYAQVKLSQETAFAVAERAQVRVDQKSARDVVILDQGRIRVVGVEAIGKPEKRAVELRTPDGTFALRGADIEAERQPLATATDASFTVVKLNAGAARLLNPEGGIAIAKDAVQGFTAGKIVTTRPVSVTDIALTRIGVGATAPAAPVPAPIRDLPLLSVPPSILQPTSTLTLIPLSPTITTSTFPALVSTTPVSSADKLLTTTYVDSTTGTTSTLTNLITSPTLTSTTSNTSTTGTLSATTSTISLTPITTTTSSTLSTFTLLLKKCC